MSWTADHAVARPAATASDRLEHPQDRGLAIDLGLPEQDDHHEQEQLQAGQQPPRMERKLMRHEALQHDRDENGTRDRQARLLGRPTQPRGLMQLPARRGEPLDVRGDVREALVNDARIHRAVRADEVVVAEHPGARRRPGRSSSAAGPSERGRPDRRRVTAPCRRAGAGVKSRPHSRHDFCECQSPAEPTHGQPYVFRDCPGVRTVRPDTVRRWRSTPSRPGRPKAAPCYATRMAGLHATTDEPPAATAATESRLRRGWRIGTGVVCWALAVVVRGLCDHAFVRARTDVVSGHAHRVHAVRWRCCRSS